MYRFRMVLVTFLLMTPGLLRAQTINPGTNPYAACLGQIYNVACSLPGAGPFCTANNAISACLRSPNYIDCLSNLGTGVCSQLSGSTISPDQCTNLINWATVVSQCTTQGTVSQTCIDSICSAAPPPFSTVCSASQAVAQCMRGLMDDISNFYQCSREAGSNANVCTACSNQAYGAVTQEMLGQAFNPCDPAFQQRWSDSCDRNCTSQVMQSNRGGCRAAGQTGGTVTGQLERCCNNCKRQCEAARPQCNNTTTTTTRVTTTTTRPTTTTTRPTTTTTTTRPPITRPTCQNASGNVCYGTSNLPCAPGCTSGSTTNTSGMTACPVQYDRDPCGPAAIWCGSRCTTTTTRATTTRVTTTTRPITTTTTRPVPTTMQPQTTTTRRTTPTTRPMSGQY